MIYDHKTGGVLEVCNEDQFKAIRLITILQKTRIWSNSRRRITHESVH
jgi:hypothetical protein